MVEEQLRKKIKKLEKELKNIEEYNEFKGQALDCAVRIKFMIDVFEKQGIDKYFAQAMILEMIKQGNRK